MNLPDADLAAVQSVLTELTQAWNASDAARFASKFASNAEHVNIFGTRLRGRREIEERHGEVFQSIFRGSTNALQIVSARVLADNVVLAQVSSVVDVPQGPLSGTLRTIASIVLLREKARWEIVLFHNTRVEAQTP